jgi:hypothetical protein
MEQLGFTLEPAPNRDVLVSGRRLVALAGDKVEIDTAYGGADLEFRADYKVATPEERDQVSLIINALKGRETVTLRKIEI